MYEHLHMLCFHETHAAFEDVRVQHDLADSGLVTDIS